MKEKTTKKAPKESDDMRPEYDFSVGVRGKYAAQYANGTNLVRLEPDVHKVFPDSDAVNSALRTLIRIGAKASVTKERVKRAG